MHKRHIAVGLVAALLAACGSVPSASDESATSAPLVLPPLPSDATDNCAPIDVLGSVSAIVSASNVVVAELQFVSRAKRDYLVLNLEDPKALSTRESRQGTPVGDDVDLSLRTVLVGPFARQGADVETLEALLAADDPVLVVAFTEIATKQVRPILRAAGRIVAGGRIELLGPCGQLLQPSLDASAASFATTATADWLVRVADPESAEAVAAVEAFMGVGADDEVATFLSTSPPDRDLTLGTTTDASIPRSGPPANRARTALVPPTRPRPSGRKPITRTAPNPGYFNEGVGV